MAGDIYIWLKALHIISVVAWMAGLLYLPRLFVYHCAAEAGSPQAKTFEIMERRLLRAIMNPAMILSLGFGGALLTQTNVVDWSGDIWIYLKLVFVALLVVLHHFLERWRIAFAAGENRFDARFYKRVNEVPTLALIAIVIFVVVKPF
ncbi:MAG: protoporphyrinogen oxidase HemJ [Proteobacteria bacterium]|nr:protoporphyrinogen oxidase HemJ [Pseudomonadota bacterium]MDA1356223.1 protoporphyrinogen oxidase HemJ [Pseudomonadota bacterium]